MKQKPTINVYTIQGYTGTPNILPCENMIKLIWLDFLLITFSFTDSVNVEKESRSTWVESTWYKSPLPLITGARDNRLFPALVIRAAYMS